MTFAKMDKLWEEYLSYNPDKKELTGILFGLMVGEKLKELAWEELKKKKDVTREELMRVMFNCDDCKKILDEAWEIFIGMRPRKEELEEIVSRFKLSHPISQKTREILGRGKHEVLREMKEMAKE
jgi:hypothetical protein